MTDRLGITGTQKVVLPALTWRDNSAVTWRLVEIVSHLDIEAASAAFNATYNHLMDGQSAAPACSGPQ